jgi:hypothetical protein
VNVALMKSVTLMVAFFTLAGCAVIQPLYSWGPYESEVYAFFKGDSVEKQIQTLEKHLNVAEAKGKILPPGYYAHLGMLYGKVGRGIEARALLDKELRLYPEASVFMNNINSGFKGRNE